MSRQKETVFNDDIQLMLRQIPALVAVLSGPDHVFEFVSDQYRKLVGAKRELVGLPVAVALPEVVNQGFLQLLDQVYKSGKSYTGREQPVMLDRAGNGLAELVYVDFIYQPVFNDNEDVTGIFVHGFDVTEHVLLRKRVEEAEARSSAMVNQATAGIAQVNTEGRFVFVNRYFSDLLQYSQAELQQKTMQDVTHPEDLPHNLLLFKKLMHTGEDFVIEKRYLRRDGSPVWVSNSVSAIRDHHGRITNVLAVVVDITAKKNAEEALRRSESTFKQFAEAMPQMAFIANAEGEIIYFNRRWYTYIGQLRGTEGWGWKEQPIHHPEDLERTVHRWKESLQTGKSYEIEYRLRRHDGVYRWHLGRAEPVRNADGQIEMWLGTNTDIHEQKMTAAALQKSKEYYENMTDNTPVMTWNTDQSGQCVFLNKQWYYYTGQNVFEGLGEGWLEVIHPDDKDFTAGKLREAHRTREPFQSEYRLRSASGEYHWHVDRGLPRFAGDGSFEGFIGAVTEIHERVEAERKLKASDERFRLIARATNDVIWDWNIRSGEMWWNDAVQSVFGYEQNVVGKTVEWRFMQIHPEDRERVRAGMNEVINEEGNSWSSEYRFRKADGTYANILDRAYVVRDKSRMLGSMLDITAAKEHERKLRQFNEQLEQKVKERTVALQRSNDDLQQFAHVASHDLKEPVRKIRVFANLIRERASGLPEEHRRYLDKIQSATGRLTNMIEGVLTYSSISATEQPLQDVDLGKVVDQVLVDLEVLISEKQALVKVGRLPVIRGAELLLYQLFYNLLNNCLKFSREGVQPEVSIYAEANEKHDFITIYVADNGIGFAPEYSERIFETFARLHTKDQYEGTGLGLALCKKIVERHGGSIRARGKENIGATFEITLPLDPEAR